MHNPVYGGHCRTNNSANSTIVASVCCQLAVYATSISPKEAVKLSEKTPICLDCHGSLCLPSDLGVAVVAFSLWPFSLARLCWGSHLWPMPLQVITHLQLIVLNFSHYLGDSSAFLITGSLYDTHQCSPNSFLCIVVSRVSLASNCLPLYIDLLGPIPVSTPGVAILIVLVSGVCGQRSVWLSPSFPGFPGALFPTHFVYSTRWSCK